ncbi:MAG: hypothetical protein U0235_22215 [Polyangiaceae bacterium]
MSIRRSTSLSIAAALTVASGLSATRAMAEDKPAVLLRTATSIAYLAPNQPDAVAKNTGAGVMDARPAFKKIMNAKGDFMVRVGVLSTVSSQTANNAGSHMQGGLYIGDLTEAGISHRPMKMLPTLDGERAFMRPQIAFGQSMNFMLLVLATEDNGANNNPQAAAFLADLDGNLLPIENTNRGTQDKPTNLITEARAQDDQTYGPHSICSLGLDGNGESFLVGMQRNNANAYVMKIKVEPGTAPGKGKITVPYFTKVVDNARHCRPQVTCPMPGQKDAYVTTVEANNQPAEVGIRLVKFNVDTGAVVTSALVAASDPDGTKTGKKSYAVQNSGLIYLANGMGAVGYQLSGNGKTDNNGDGHAGGANLSALATVRLADLQVMDRTTSVAPYQRHAFSFATNFGPGAGKPAIAVMGGSSTGTGKGLIQIVEVDGAGHPSMSKNNLFDVSLYSDVANLPARGKRNPNNQGAGFLNGVGGVDNPGFGKPNGFLPEVKQFFVSALPGFAQDPQKNPAVNRESLWISLVPQNWVETIQAVPGPVTQDIPLGPSPKVDPTQPTGVGNAGLPPGEPTGNVAGTGDSGFAQTNSGCSAMGRRPVSSSSEMVWGVLLAVCALSRRRVAGAFGRKS